LERVRARGRSTFYRKHSLIAEHKVARYVLACVAVLYLQIKMQMRLRRQAGTCARTTCAGARSRVVAQVRPPLHADAVVEAS